MPFTRHTMFLLSVAASMYLPNCSRVMTARELNKPVQALNKPSEVFKKSESGGIEWLEYSQIYKEIQLARKLEKKQPNQAIGHYLNAAHIAWKTRDERVLPLYNHACGQVADLLLENGVRDSASFYVNDKRVTVRLKSSGSHTSLVNDVDDLIPADCLKRSGLEAEVKQYGVGAAMVALHSLNDKKQNPFTAIYGGAYPVTAVLDFERPNEIDLTLYDAVDVNSIRFWGEQMPLEYNLTSSYYGLSTLVKKQGSISKILGVFKPTKYSGRMGLHLAAQYDPDKIPLILVHGLVSSPYTWVDPINQILEDEEIRRNYQLYTFYYPTGFPVRMTGAKLKEDLIKLQNYARKNGGAESVDKMVVFGHSMGGMLTSLNIRELDQDAWSKISNEPIDEAAMSESMRHDMKMIFQEPQVESIKRVVFIATPHRGSNMANSWYGNFIATMIRIPQDVVRLDFASATQSFTDLGKSIFNNEGPVNSMVNLRVGNPAVQFVNAQKISPRVTYHTIVGDRGKGDSPESSDGVVPYWSSHLEGVKSELIVPSGHSAHHNPQAIEEMKRILLEHLKVAN